MFPSEEEKKEKKKRRENQSAENYTQTTRPPIRYERNTGRVKSLKLVTDGAIHSLTHSQRVLLQKQVGSSHALIHTASSPCRTAASHATDSRACGQLLVLPELNSRPVTGQMNLFLAQWMWVTTPLG